MDNYKHFIAGVTNVALRHVHVITEIDGGMKPEVSRFVKLIDAVKYEDGQYYTYYKDMKAVLRSFIIYWRQTMDIATNRADYLCYKFSESADKELMVLNVVNTVRLWQDYQKKFYKEFLPIESPKQQKIYNDLDEKFLEHMKNLYELKLHLEKLDRRDRIVAFAKEQYAKSVELKNEVFLYAHNYISMLLADHLPEIGGSLKEILTQTRNNLKQLEEEREAALSDLWLRLYEKNKEKLMYTRQKRNSVSQMAEIGKGIKKIRNQVLNTGNHDPISKVAEKLEYYENKYTTFEKIEKNLNTLKAELEKTYREESIYNSRTTTELPGSKFQCWQEMGKNFATRREELKQLLIKAAKSLTTFFVVKSMSEEVMLNKNEIGDYSIDIFGHSVYHFDYGLKAHLDCQGNYSKRYDNHAFYTDENGQYFVQNNEKIYQKSDCTNLYKLGDDMLMQKVTPDFDHSERAVEECAMCAKDFRAVPEILPHVEPVNIKSTLNAEVVKYLWDALGSILPDALYDVCERRPRNPIHCLAHSLLKHKYTKTPAELLQKKKQSEMYRTKILEERKEKCVAESLAWKAKQPQRSKPEHCDDSHSRAFYDIYVAANQFIASLDYYN